MSENGYFAANNREFVITDKRLPREWLQYLWNDATISQMDEQGNGYCFHKHPGGARSALLKGPRLVYVKDRETSEYWSFPGGYDSGEAVYGLGYTQYRRQVDGISAELKITVPGNLKGEAWQVRLLNESNQPRRLSVYTFTEIDLRDYKTSFGHRCMVETEWNEELQGILYLNHESDCPIPSSNGFACACRKPDAFETVVDLFTGHFHGLERPNALNKDFLENNSNHGIWDRENGITHAILQFDIDLASNAGDTVVVLYGVFEDRREINVAVDQYIRSESLESDLNDRLKASSIRHESIELSSPDPVLDRLYDRWIKHNMDMVARWTRIYSRGFRDTLQDTMGVVALDPDLARKNLLTALSHEFHTGRCLRAWDVFGVALSEQHYTDGPIWIPLAVNEYIRETGDTDILDVTCPYYDEGEGTVLEHMLQAARYLYNDRGDHGLCRIHDGDWCDTAHLLGKKGHGEGVWLSIALYNAVKEIRELANFIERPDLVSEMESMASVIAEAVNEHGWDGKWFLIAYNDEGRPIGSSRADEGRLFLNPQSWAVLSGVTSPERENQCLRAIDEMLDSSVGPLLLTPPYTKPDKGIGSLTSFRPGTIENGSCYCHAAAFKIVADIRRRRGGKAYETLMKIIPGGLADQLIETADCPPYAFTNSRVAPFHPYMAGSHLDTWITGTVSWCWQAVTEWMLGPRRTFEGLLVDPCIPPHWDGFSVKRRFRGAEYHVSVINPDHVESGVRKVIVDGEEIEGCLLPISGNGSYQVEVTMGKCP